MINKTDFIAKLDRIDGLPTLPEIVLEVNNLLNHDPVDIDRLSTTIENDPAMVTRMLQLVNSSFFGLESRVSTASRAIVILGFNTVRSAVVTISIIKAFHLKNKTNAFDISKFWRHAVGVAVISKYLAGMSDIAPPEEAFTGGILHDIGKVVMAHFFTDSFKNIVKAVQQNGTPFHENEAKFIPMGHARIGDYLARKWNLPRQLRHAILYHHAIDTADTHPVACLVHLADMIAWHPEGLPELKVPIRVADPAIFKTALSCVKGIYDNLTNINDEIETAFHFLLKGKYP